MRILTLALAGMIVSLPATSVVAAGLADKEQSSAYDCIKSQAEGYGLASCERAVDIMPIVEKTCKKLLNKYTDAAFKDERLKPLPLDKRLEISGKMQSALISHVPKIVMDARIKAKKNCS